VHLEASTKPPIHNLIHEFLINMAFTMACPNFKKGMKMAFGPLGVNQDKQISTRRFLLTPKGLNVRTADKPVLVCVT
jgi:hypothetical protein